VLQFNGRLSVEALAHRSWPPITKKHNTHILAEKVQKQKKRAKVNGVYMYRKEGRGWRGEWALTGGEREGGGDLLIMGGRKGKGRDRGGEGGNPRSHGE